MKTYKEVKIKVIGVGGAGCNAVSYMQTQQLKNVQLIACNTGAASLSVNPIQDKLLLHINPSDTKFNTSDPEIAKQAALNKIGDIKALLSDDIDIVFVVAGMGGSAGTGASPVIAQVAKKLGILTVGIVTTPFSFEGDKKAEVAAAGIDELGKFSDSLLVFSNNKLREQFGDLSIKSAFNKVDEHISHAVRVITEIVTVSAEVNVDIEDVRIVLKDAGVALVGSAITTGKNRARLAAEQATDFSLLVNSDMRGTSKILLSIVSGSVSEFGMDELTEITEYIQDKAGEDAEIIFGHSEDENLQESIRVTLIAAGFSEN